MSNYNLTHLDELESESIFILREVFAQFENPCILFSGGKDSIVVTHLAKKAFYPAKIPFSLVHIDTGHNFPETMVFRDQIVADLEVQLIVGLHPEMPYKPIPFSIPSTYISLMLVSVAHDGTKKKPGLKKDFFHIEMNLGNGILKINAQNCGICSMVNITKENILGYSP
jgi:hypothetical protein